jgi:hypothetical protein
MDSLLLLLPVWLYAVRTAATVFGVYMMQQAAATCLNKTLPGSEARQLQVLVLPAGSSGVTALLG